MKNFIKLSFIGLSLCLPMNVPSVHGMEDIQGNTQILQTILTRFVNNQVQNIKWEDHNAITLSAEFQRYIYIESLAHQNPNYYFLLTQKGLIADEYQQSVFNFFQDKNALKKLQEDSIQILNQQMQQFSLNAKSNLNERIQTVNSLFDGCELSATNRINLILENLENPETYGLTPQILKKTVEDYVSNQSQFENLQDYNNNNQIQNQSYNDNASLENKLDILPFSLEDFLQTHPQIESKSAGDISDAFIKSLNTDAEQNITLLDCNGKNLKAVCRYVVECIKSNTQINEGKAKQAYESEIVPELIQTLPATMPKNNDEGLTNNATKYFYWKAQQDQADPSNPNYARLTLNNFFQTYYGDNTSPEIKKVIEEVLSAQGMGQSKIQ